MHIAIAGNIGSGKTTLTTMLARHYGWTPRFEPVMDNPYLEDYYHDIKRWAFNLEVYFLKERFRDILDILANPEITTIQDRSIFEGVYVFVANNYAQGQLSDRDFEAYMELFEQMTEIVKFPDLMIYLRAPIEHLVANIQKRGRDYEQTISLDYLKGLNAQYEDFIFNKYKGKVMVVDVNGLDYQHNQEDFMKITDKIDADLYGLFSEQRP
ncbi:MAG: deoxynucleoside kinase [Prevotella sp.]